MAENLVKFVSCDALGFARIESKDPYTLYFVSDERRIYKGDVPMSGGIYKAVTEFPGTGETNVLYLNTSTGEVRFYDGTNYQVLVKPMGEVAETDQGLVTGAQVYAAISTVNNAADTLTERVSAVENKNTTQDAAISAAQSKADQGVTDAATAQAAAEAAQSAASKAQEEVDTLEGTVATLAETVNTKASQADLTTLADRVTIAEGDIDDLTDNKADKSALETEIARAKAAEEANAAAAKEAKEAADAAQSDIDAFFAAAETGEDALDTLKELQNYLTTEGAAADQMVKDIAANKAAIEAEVTRAKAAEEANAEAIGVLDGDVSDLQDQVGTGTVDERIEAAKTAAATDAQAKADAAKDAAIEAAAADATTKANAAEAAATSAAKIETTSQVNAAKTELETYADQAEADALAAAKEYADGLAGNYASAAQGAKADTAVQSVTEGTENGTITVDDAGMVTQVKVHGLGTAAYTAASSYATAAQGTKADSALQASNIAEGSTNGTISVKGTDVAVHGLGSAAYTDSTAYATADQGALAASAVQSVTTGNANGKINVDGTQVSVYGLKSAAYTESTAYATAAQGDLADTALQKADITTGGANGTIAVDGTDVAVKGLGSAAYTASSAYATAAQGTKADNSYC